MTLTLDANDARLVNGTVAIRSSAPGLGFTAALRGDVSPLVPPDFRGFFGPGSIDVAGLRLANGGLRIDTARITGPVLDLDGQLETAPGASCSTSTSPGAWATPRRRRSPCRCPAAPPG